MADPSTCDRDNAEAQAWAAWFAAELDHYKRENDALWDNLADRDEQLDDRLPVAEAALDRVRKLADKFRADDSSASAVAHAFAAEIDRAVDGEEQS